MMRNLHFALPLGAILIGYGVEAKQPNILLIVADDLNCSTTSMFGSKVDDITPNLQRLSDEGVLFTNAHVTTGVSQPSRGTMTTGLYPHNNGIDGFYQTTLDIPTLQESLLDANYRIGILGKVAHSTPKKGIKWGIALDGEECGYGRNPQLYAEKLLKFIKRGQELQRPFFFMANSHDPHRPFSGSEQERQKFPTHPYPAPSRTYQPDEIEIPPFLPDLPDVRREVAQYYSSVRRLDDTVGALLEALDKSGEADNTIVIFLSDNGMSAPFAKSNCYFQSTQTPLIVRDPSLKRGRVNESMVSTINLMPTILDYASISIPRSLDGVSLRPVIRGESEVESKYVFTEYGETSSCRRFPMRAVQDEKFGYIYNAWSDGERRYSAESLSGLSFAAMVKAANNGDEAVAKRVEMINLRVVEELYDMERDPAGLNNLVNNPKYNKELEHYRKVMENHLKTTNDPLYELFVNRDNAQYIAKYMDQIQSEANERLRIKKLKREQAKAKR